jgi:hypothetical protein
MEQSEIRGMGALSRIPAFGLHPGYSAAVGCAVRTGKKIQAVDSWCAWRTLQEAVN